MPAVLCFSLCLIHCPGSDIAWEFLQCIEGGSGTQIRHGYMVFKIDIQALTRVRIHIFQKFPKKWLLAIGHIKYH